MKQISILLVGVGGYGAWNATEAEWKSVS